MALGKDVSTTHEADHRQKLFDLSWLNAAVSEGESVLESEQTVPLIRSRLKKK